MKYAALLFGGIWLYAVLTTVLDPLGHNPQGEFCDYVSPGEPYDLIYDGYPCRLTSQLFIERGLGLAFIGTLLQVPTLIIWINIAYRNWRLKRRQGGVADE